MARVKEMGPAISSHSRPERVGDIIRVELSSLLTRDARDPHIQNVTITRVQMTKDLQYARVYFTLLTKDDDVLKASRGLRRAKPFFKRKLGHIGLRHVPDLRFLYDESVEQQDRVARLLDEIRTPDFTDSNDHHTDEI